MKKDSVFVPTQKTLVFSKLSVILTDSKALIELTLLKTMTLMVKVEVYLDKNEKKWQCKARKGEANKNHIEN